MYNESLTSSDRNSSYIAKLYLQIATKLAEDGSSEKIVEDVGPQIRILLQKTTFDWGAAGALVRRAADAEARALKTLCRKLLEYTGLVKVKEGQVHY